MQAAVVLVMLVGIGQPSFVNPSPDITPEDLLQGAFSGAVTEALVKTLSGPPQTFGSNWGNKTTFSVIDGGHWEWEGVKSHWVNHYRQYQRNDGLWTRGSLSLEDPAHQLHVQFSDFKPVPGRLDVSFQIYATAEFRGNYEARYYKDGLEVASVTAGARAVGTINLTMRVYLTNNASILHWQVVSSNLDYSDVTLDRLGVMGGETAKVVGDSITGSIKEFMGKKRQALLSGFAQIISKDLSGNLDLRLLLVNLIKKLPH